MVFDKAWFKDYQRVLLWLLNTPQLGIGFLFRWILRIRKCDLPYSTRILEIGTNWFTHSAKLKGDQVELQTSFRSNEKYARRLWFAFEPLWWVLHAWDMVTKPLPILNLGFDTLPTKYSTPGSAVSGYAARHSVDQTLAAIRAGAGTLNSYDTGSNGLICQVTASSTLNQFANVIRAILLFDCSALPDTAVVNTATIGIYVDSKGIGLGAFEMDIVSSAPASNTALANSDYANLDSTPFSSIASASLTASAYNSFSLNAGGKANISSTGISKFGARVNWDTDNSFGGLWVATQFSYAYCTDGGYASTTRDPKIDITYTVPAAVGISLLLMGVG